MRERERERERERGAGCGRARGIGDRAVYAGGLCIEDAEDEDGEELVSGREVAGSGRGLAQHLEDHLCVCVCVCVRERERERERKRNYSHTRERAREIIYATRNVS